MNEKSTLCYIRIRWYDLRHLLLFRDPNIPSVYPFSDEKWLQITSDGIAVTGLSQWMKRELGPGITFLNVMSNMHNSNSIRIFWTFIIKNFTNKVL